MWSELLQVFREINNSVRDRVLVLTGAGGDFCSGADVGGMDERANTAEPASDDPPRHQLASMRNITDICLTLNRLPQPTIAKVRGVAVGAGLNMALSCDLVVGDETSRYSEIFARRGLSLDFGGSFLLPRRASGSTRQRSSRCSLTLSTPRKPRLLASSTALCQAASLTRFVDDWAKRLASGPADCPRYVETPSEQLDECDTGRST